jgi:hypothetical protein
MAPNLEQVNAEVQMMKSQTKEFRDETRDDFQRIFTKLEVIHDGMTEMKSKPACADPSACVRIGDEVKTLRAAMEQFNSRLGVMETDKRIIIGLKTYFLGGCFLVGWLIDAAISWFHK